MFVTPVQDSGHSARLRTLAVTRPNGQLVKSLMIPFVMLGISPDH